MTKGYVVVRVGSKEEKRYLTSKYQVYNIKDVEKNNTQTKTKDGKEEMIRLTKKDLMEQIRIMRMDLVDGTIDKAVDNCGTYNRVNKDTIHFWGIEEEVCDYELKLKKCTLLKTPAFKKEVAKYLENDFDIRGVRIVVGGVFGTAEVLVDVEDVVTGKLVEVCYLWDNKCNYSKHRELEKKYPDAKTQFELEEEKIEMEKYEKMFAKLKDAKVEEVAHVLGTIFDNTHIQANEFETIEYCLNDDTTELGGLVIKRLEEMVKYCTEKNNLKRNEECVLEFAINNMFITDELYSKIEIVRFKAQGIVPEYDSFIEGEIHKSINENKVALFKEYNLKVEFNHEEKEVVIYDVVKQIEGQIDLISYEKSIEKSDKLDTPKKKIKKEEEKEMNTINKNALNNRMVKLGEFLKENKDKDVIQDKVLELFPKAMEIDVYEGDNVIYFLVGQEYVGKAPTKKEMKELDRYFKEVDRVYGLSVYISVESDKITMNANVGIDYTDIYGLSNYTDCTIKEIEMELELVTEIVEKRCQESFQKKIEVLEKSVTGKITVEDAKEILGNISDNTSVDWDNQYGYCVVSNKDENMYLGVGDTEEIYRCKEIIGTKNIQFKIEYVKNINEMIIIASGDVEYIHEDGEVLVCKDVCFYYKEIKCSQESKTTTETLYESELIKQIKDHVNAVLDLSTQENNEVGCMYKKTVAVRKNNIYEFTSEFEDMWTGMTVYIGNSTNIFGVSNSEKSILTHEIELVLMNEKSVNDTILDIEKKIKSKFEYAYSKV